MLPFGQTVLLWRLHQGLSQQALAARARIPQPNLSAIERGAREVSLKTVRALALALDVTPGVLVDGTPPESRGPWSRGRLERVAQAAARGKPLANKEEHQLASSLRTLLSARERAARRPRRLPRRMQRRAERAWLVLAAAHPRERRESLLARASAR